MTTPLLHPRAGTPEVLVTREEVAAAAERLAAGTGPLAVDTERASAYVYDDRALLIQLRRAGAGTFLIDPETEPGAVADLPDALNPLPWVLHAAPSDLPCLTALGLLPAELFDTEIAGRLLGLDRVNLAAMTERFLGVSLAKGHGREDWSRRPLPADWLDYAALDVELLPELAETLGDALSELDRMDWLLDETRAIITRFAPDAADGGAAAPLNNPDPEGWRHLKGIGALRRPDQLVVARELWRERDARARSRDVSPTRVLAHDVIVAVARELPRTEQELGAIRGFPRRRRGAAADWMRVVRRALALPEADRPRRLPSAHRGIPHHRDWPERAPQAARALELLEPAYRTAAGDLGIAPETLLPPKVMRRVAWVLGGADGDVPAPADGDGVRRLLRAEGAHPWQEDILAPVVVESVLLPCAQPLS
ncbi:HRDC domain-containing protein [Corynebacterium sp. 335C]